MVAGLLVVASGCSGDGDASRTAGPTGPAGTSEGDAGQTPPSSESAEDRDAEGQDAEGPAGAGGAGGGEGCTGAGPTVPDDAGAGVGEIVDVDGDGRGDTGWLGVHDDGSRTLGVATAAGGGDVAPVESGSPGLLTMLVVDADEEAPVELLVSDGHTAGLWAFADCRLAQVVGPDGEPYLFDLGMRGNGTGVGCHGTGGGRQLVGLDVADDDGRVVEWTRTVVERDGLAARHGETDRGRYERPGDAEAIALLYSVTCGDMTIDEDGIREPLL